MQHRAGADPVLIMDDTRRAWRRRPALDIASLKNSQNRDSGGTREMHRTRVTADHQIEAGDQSRELSRGRLKNYRYRRIYQCPERVADLGFFRAEKGADSQAMFSKFFYKFGEIFERPAFTAELAAADKYADSFSAVLSRYKFEVLVSRGFFGR